MTDAENVTDSDRLDEALGELRGVTVDAATIRAHVMRPANVLDVTSDQGLDVERVPTPAGHVDGGLPEESLSYVLDRNGFVNSIQAAFEHSVARNPMRLNENGAPIAMLD